MDEKHGNHNLIARRDSHVCPRQLGLYERFKKKADARSGILVVLLCVVLWSGTRSVYQTYRCRELQPSTVHISNSQSSTSTIRRRDNAAVGDSISSNEAVTTDSEGTWVIASAAASSNVQDPFSDTPTSTTTETASLTDRIIISFTTETKLSTITVTPSRTYSITSSTTDKSTSSTSANLTTSSSSPRSIITGTVIPASLCPYATCAPTCPWTTCTSLPPTTMDTNLCQMLDPCFFAQRVYLPKPPSQGGMCACLCESGYCTNPKDGKGKNVKLSCAEWDCCHQCECYPGNPMADQSGRGDC